MNVTPTPGRKSVAVFSFSLSIELAVVTMDPFILTMDLRTGPVSSASTARRSDCGLVGVNRHICSGSFHIELAKMLRTGPVSGASTARHSD